MTWVLQCEACGDKIKFNDYYGEYAYLVIQDAGNSHTGVHKSSRCYLDGKRYLVLQGLEVDC